MGKQSANQACCKKCQNCPAGFQKILELKMTGLVIYRHSVQTQSINADTGQTLRRKKSTEDIFILHNTKDIDICSADYVPEMENNTVSCPRCRKIKEHAQKLAEKVPTITKHDVRGVCDHCLLRENACVDCEKIVQKFVDTKKEVSQHTKESINVRMSKIKHLLKDVSKVHEEDRRKRDSELFIDRVTRRSPTGTRQLNVNDLFKDPERGPTDRRGEYEVKEIFKVKKFPESLPDHDDNVDLKEVRFKIMESIPPVPFQSFANIVIPVGVQSNMEFNREQEQLSGARPRTTDDVDPIARRASLPSDKKIALKQKHADEKITIPQPEDNKSAVHRRSSTPTKPDKTSISENKIPTQKEFDAFTSPPTYIRKYYSEESIFLSNLGEVKENEYDKDFSYFFPKKVLETIQLRRQRSSTELIRETQDKLFAKAEEEREKVEMERKKKMEEEEKKRIAREEKQKLAKDKKKEKQDTVSPAVSTAPSMDSRPTSEKSKEPKTKPVKEPKPDKEPKDKSKDDEKAQKAKEQKEEKEKAKREKELREKEEKERAKKEKEAQKEDKDKAKKDKDEEKERAKREKEEEKERARKEKEAQKEELEKAKREKESKAKEDKEKANKDKEAQKEEKDRANKEKEEREKAKKEKEEEIRRAKEEKEKEKKQKENEIAAQKSKMALQKEKEEDRKNRAEAAKAAKEALAKLGNDTPEPAKPAKPEPKRDKKTELPTTKELSISKIKVKKENPDAILELVRLRQSEQRRKDPKDLLKVAEQEIKKHKQHSTFKGECVMCVDSDLEFEVESIILQNKEDPDKMEDIILSQKIGKYKPPLVEKPDRGVVPLLFKTAFVDSDGPESKDEGSKTATTKVEEKGKAQGKQAKSVNEQSTKGVIRFKLSDRSFIDKGWTMLPTEKVVRKMNVYRMRPAHPEFDWFEHNKRKRLMEYDTGEKLAEFDDNGRGRWFYRNGRMALDYYDAKEANAHQRFVIYSSGEPDERGRAQPYTILATFDYLGNGVVFDNAGKIRLKYNQTEGILLDRSVGPVSHWKWHTLNDPPVLQKVMIDTQMALKDPVILKLGPNDAKYRPDNEDMLAIEFDNFIKEKSKKLSQSFKPFQIKMKALKINKNFSLKILDQATVYLIFRDGTANMKMNIGMVLDHKEIVDTDTAEVGDVSNSLERFPARTDSLAQLQRDVASAQRFDKLRGDRERRLRRPEPAASADMLGAAASKPLRPPLLTAASCTTTNADISCKCSRKPLQGNVYRETSLFC